ncbi:MAG: efflux RND transporter periplasmic adaptor subunit [Candidatus Omnitrophota bacterium]
MFNEEFIKDVKELIRDLKLVDYKKLLKNRKLVMNTVLALVFLIAAFHIRGCIAERRKKAIPPRPVHIATVVKEDVPIYVDSFGALTSINSADIKAQVTGEIKEVHFKEGDEVKKGDPLFVIDPAPYKAQVEKAKAALDGDQVDLKLKTDTLERNKKLFEKGLISQQEYENYLTEKIAAEAQAELDKANLEMAKINLDYCYINAPISGLAGKRQVDKGNVVTANTGPTLVNIKTIENLYVDFTAPEKNLANIRKAMEVQKLKVQITVEGEEDETYEGELSFLDNTVDDLTGTVSLRAIVSNEEQKLWPGQFVQVHLILRTEEDALLVPYESVQIGQQGSYLFVVTSRKKADLRIVTPGMREGDLIIIKKGVKAGERVVTVGQMGLSPGAPVVDVGKKEEKRR